MKVKPFVQLNVSKFDTKYVSIDLSIDIHSVWNVWENLIKGNEKIHCFVL